MPKPLEPAFVCVLHIRSGESRYSGTSYAKAAQALDPGTCFGKGHSLEEARREALGWVKHFQERRAA